MGVISSLGDAPGNPVIDRDICTLCGACAAICPVEVLTKGDNGIAINNTNAFGCFACTYAMIAAESLGLGSYMIGCAAPVLGRRKEMLGKVQSPRRKFPEDPTHTGISPKPPSKGDQKGIPVGGILLRVGGN